MRKDLLLEIGTEEIPARFMPGILKQLAETAQTKLEALRIGFEKVRTLGTPRRMTLIVEGVEECQADQSSENKGPSIKVAFDADGNPTKAGLGFAKRWNLDAKNLTVKDGYVYANVHEKGGETAALLKDVLPELLHGMNFPKNMRWADLELRFVRPIRWIVALFGTDTVKFEIAGVVAENISRGHRFLGASAVPIENAAAYEQALRDNFVIVDPDIRRAMIREQVAAIAEKQGGHAEITEDLLEEVVFLVEYPTALCGNFDPKYLALPPEAIITPMREHQRYFPVKSSEGKLMPMFITVRNGGDAHIEMVRHGNERVLRARLDDAKFFFEEDRKVKLVDRREKLKTVVFQEGLGTIYDKTERLAKLAVFAAEAAGETQELDAIRRAALLSKADLVTGMVCEFTELQGVMGREYARLDGEDTLVSQAIYEHYLPRFAGDVLPEAAAGRFVGIADKIDNIVATFSRGLVPTGSQDPYALRRQALGIVNILIASRTSLSLRALAEQAMDLLGILDAEKRKAILGDMEEFFRLRLKNVLNDQGIRYDVVDAVLETADDVYAVCRQAQAIAEEIEHDDMTSVVQAFVRAGNLAKKAKSSEIDSTSFVVEEERALFAAYDSARAVVQELLTARDYIAALRVMKTLGEPIHHFFDGVMVMDPNPAVQKNRLALLKGIVDLTLRIADFSKIIL